MRKFPVVARGRQQLAPADLDAVVGEVRRVWLGLRSQPMDALVEMAQQLRSRRSGVVDWSALAAEVARRLRQVGLHEGQLAAGVALAEGLTVAMRTGEGQTFAAGAPAAIYAAQGRPVHVVTANPYLAGRDADWSCGVLRALGFTTGVTIPGMARRDTRRAAGSVHGGHAPMEGVRPSGFGGFRR